MVTSDMVGGDGGGGGGGAGGDADVVPWDFRVDDINIIIAL